MIWCLATRSEAETMDSKWNVKKIGECYEIQPARSNGYGYASVPLAKMSGYTLSFEIAGVPVRSNIVANTVNENGNPVAVADFALTREENGNLILRNAVSKMDLGKFTFDCWTLISISIEPIKISVAINGNLVGEMNSERTVNKDTVLSFYPEGNKVFRNITVCPN